MYCNIAVFTRNKHRKETCQHCFVKYITFLQTNTLAQIHQESCCPAHQQAEEYKKSSETLLIRVYNVMPSGVKTKPIHNEPPYFFGRAGRGDDFSRAFFTELLRYSLEARLSNLIS
jgi:hypothetical protein